MDDRWFTDDERLIRFRKSTNHIVVRVKGAESPSVKGSQYSEENVLVWKRDPQLLIGHQSVSLTSTGIMRLLFKCVTMVPVIIADKSQS